MLKKISTIALCLMLLLTLFTTACSKEEETDDSDTSVIKKELDKANSDYNNPEYLKEQDGAEIVVVPHDQKDYIGTWVAPSDYAEYLYGNVTLRIFEDNTWNGNITNESFKGKWYPDGSGIVIKDGEGIINWTLFYEGDGNLMFRNADDPDIALVLKKSRL